RAEYRRPTGRAEPPLRSALVILAGGLERGERAALKLERLARNGHDDRERGSGLALAVRAVASPLPDRLGIDAIGHATAEAAPRDGSGSIGHAPETIYQRLRRGLSSSAGIATRTAG